MKLVAPVVHRNGTSKESLLEQYCEAKLALYKAMEAVRHIETHDRDYYVHPEANAGQTARARRSMWMQMLSTIEREVCAIACAIQSGEDHTNDVLDEIEFTIK